LASGIPARGKGSPHLLPASPRKIPAPTEPGLKVLQLHCGGSCEPFVALKNTAAKIQLNSLANISKYPTLT
jgi:hypothetical protein